MAPKPSLEMKQRFIEALDTPGGHILVCLFLIVIGAVMQKFFGLQQGSQLVSDAMIALCVVLRVRGNDNANNK